MRRPNASQYIVKFKIPNQYWDSSNNHLLLEHARSGIISHPSEYMLEFMEWCRFISHVRV